MASVGRLAGALLAETEGRWFLIGNTKEPCDFRLAGFEPPAEIDAVKQAYIGLRSGSSAPCLTLDLEGVALVQLLARRFVNACNGLVRLTLRFRAPEYGYNYDTIRVPI